MSYTRLNDGSLLIDPPPGIRVRTRQDKSVNLHEITVSFDHAVTLAVADEAIALDEDYVETTLRIAILQLAANVNLKCEEILLRN